MKEAADLLAAVRRLEIEGRHLSYEHLWGLYRSRFIGAGLEFEEVRAYAPGDEVRSIDWKVTARTGVPHVKTFREERQRTLCFLADISASTYFSSCGLSKREAIATVVALLGAAALRCGDKVAALLFAGEVEAYLPPKRGRQPLQRLLRDLLYLESKGDGSDLGGALIALSHLHKRPLICIILTDYSYPPPAAELRLASKRYDLVCIPFSDPLEGAWPTTRGLTPLQELESGRHLLVDTGREELIAKSRAHYRDRCLSWQSAARACNATFIPLHLEAPLLPPLLQALQRRRRR